MPHLLTLCFAVSLLSGGLSEEPPLIRVGDAVEVVLAGEEDGSGDPPSVVFRCSPRLDGVLFIFATSEDGDPELSILDESGEELDYDLDSGGGTSAWVRIISESDDVLGIVLTSQDGEGGTVILHVEASPESEETRAAAVELRAAIRDGSALRLERRVEEARDLLREAVDTALDTAGAELSDQIARELFPMISALYSVGDLPTALRSARHVLQHRTRTLPPLSPELQKARLNYATVFKESGGDLREVLELEQSVLDAFLATFPEQHPNVLMVRQGLGSTLEQLGHVSEASKHARAVYEGRRATLSPDDRQLLAARSNLALNLSNLGDLEGAVEHQQAVVESYERAYPDDVINQVRQRLNLADYIRDLGDIDQARRMLERSAIVAARLPDGHPLMQTARLSLGKLLVVTGEPHAGRVLLERALSAFPDTMAPDHPRRISAEVGLAGALMRTGDAQGAREIFERALKVRSRTRSTDDPEVQFARGNLAAVLSELSEHEAALPLRQEVLRSFERTHEDGNAELEKARISVAITLFHLNRLDEARALAEACLDNSRREQSDHQVVAIARTTLAHIAFTRGDFEAAERLWRQVVEESYADRSRDDLALLRVQTSLLTTLAESDDPGPTRSTARELIDGLRAHFDSRVWPVSPREAEEMVGSLDRPLSVLLSLALGSFGEPMTGLQADIFELVEAARSPGLRKVMAIRAIRSIDADDAMHSAQERVRSRTAELARVAREGGDDEAFRTIRRAREDAQRALFRLTPAGERALGLDLRTLAAALPEDGAAVTFRRYARTIPRTETRRNATPTTVASFAAAVVRPGEPLRYVDLGPADAIETAVRDYRNSIGSVAQLDSGRGKAVERESVSRDADLGDAGRRLAERVLRPLQEHMGDARHWFVVPDGELFLIPFDALPLGTQIVGDAHRVTLLPTLALLGHERPEPRTGLSLVTLGDIDYGPDGAGDGFKRLPETLGEIAAISELFRLEHPAASEEDVRQLTGDSATRSALFATAPGARLVHMATHGYFAVDSLPAVEDRSAVDAHLGLASRLSRSESAARMTPMLLCGLALAGANSAADATGRRVGVVTAEELSTLDLGDCDLAVLSACETSVGLRHGQAIHSLQTALFAAGVRTSLTSLWRVPDRETRELMETFYRGLWQDGLGKADALWNAKMRLRAAGAPSAHWAGWVLAGEP